MSFQTAVGRLSVPVGVFSSKIGLVLLWLTQLKITVLKLKKIRFLPPQAPTTIIILLSSPVLKTLKVSAPSDHYSPLQSTKTSIFGFVYVYVYVYKKVKKSKSGYI